MTSTYCLRYSLEQMSIILQIFAELKLDQTTPRNFVGVNGLQTLLFFFYHFRAVLSTHDNGILSLNDFKNQNSFSWNDRIKWQIIFPISNTVSIEFVYCWRYISRSKDPIIHNSIVSKKYKCKSPLNSCWEITFI